MIKKFLVAIYMDYIRTIFNIPNWKNFQFNLPSLIGPTLIQSPEAKNLLIKAVDKLNSELIKKGLSNECQLSRRTLLIFIEIFGEIAGDLALFTLAYNGVYLLGRLTRELTPLILENNIFMNHFKNKDHFWFLLERIPVYLIQNENIELIGITEAARRSLEEMENDNHWINSGFFYYIYIFLFYIFILFVFLFNIKINEYLFYLI